MIDLRNSTNPLGGLKPWTIDGTPRENLLRNSTNPLGGLKLGAARVVRPYAYRFETAQIRLAD